MKLSSEYSVLAVITLFHVCSFDMAEGSLPLPVRASEHNPLADQVGPSASSASESPKLPPSVTLLKGEDNDRLQYRVSAIRLDTETLMPQDENSVHTYVANVRQFREEGAGTARDLINRAGSDSERQVQLKSLEEEPLLLEENLGQLQTDLHESLAKCSSPITRQSIETILMHVADLESIHQFMYKPVHTNLRHFAAGDIWESISGLQHVEFEEEDIRLFDRMKQFLDFLKIENEQRALASDPLLYRLLRIFFQTVEFAYKHELMTQSDLRRLFEPQFVLRLAAQNMFESFWYEHRIIDYIYVIGGNDILQSWYSSHFRNIIDALETEKMRIISYYFLQFYNDATKLNPGAQSFHPEILEIQRLILQEDKALKMLKGLQSDDKTIKKYRKDVSEALQVTLKKFQKFKYTKNAPPRLSGHEFQKLNFLFQVLNFAKYNSSVMPSKNSVADLYANDVEFRRKMDAMSISNRLLQKLETIEYYLHKHLISPIIPTSEASISHPMDTKGKSVVLIGKINEEDKDKETHKEGPFQRKLEELSIYVRHILFQHHQEISNLHSKKVDTQFKQVYCHSQHISQKIKKIETLINEINSHHLSRSSGIISSSNLEPQPPVIAAPSKLWDPVKNFLKSLAS